MSIINNLKKFSPNKEKIKEYKILKIFGNFIHEPNLWHFNRNSVSKAFAVGLFVAWIPLPLQMALAAFGAIIFNANLSLSVALVWLTNPITMPPLCFFAYVLGAKILHLPIKTLKFEISTEFLHSLIGDILKPFLLGSLICAIVSAFLGYVIVQILWRYMIIKNWQNRLKKRRESRENQENKENQIIQEQIKKNLL